MILPMISVCREGRQKDQDFMAGLSCILSSTLPGASPPPPPKENYIKPVTRSYVNFKGLRNICVSRQGNEGFIREKWKLKREVRVWWESFASLILFKYFYIVQTRDILGHWWNIIWDLEHIIKDKERVKWALADEGRRGFRILLTNGHLSTIAKDFVAEILRQTLLVITTDWVFSGGSNVRPASLVFFEIRSPH